MAVAPHWQPPAPGHVHPLGPQAATANRHVYRPTRPVRTPCPASRKSNVVLIDSQLTDSSQLIADVAPGSKVFVYNSQSDTAAEVLAAGRRLGRSHGQPD